MSRSEHSSSENGARVKRYRIKKFLVLGFLTPRDQEDRIYRAADSSGVVVESDGETIWVVENDRREESVTEAHAIGLWVEEGLLEEIVE
jgi:hypothetical protein